MSEDKIKEIELLLNKIPTYNNEIAITMDDLIIKMLIFYPGNPEFSLYFEGEIKTLNIWVSSFIDIVVDYCKKEYNKKDMVKRWNLIKIYKHNMRIELLRKRRGLKRYPQKEVELCLDKIEGLLGGIELINQKIIEVLKFIENGTIKVPYIIDFWRANTENPKKLTYISVDNSILKHHPYLLGEKDVYETEVDGIMLYLHYDGETIISYDLTKRSWVPAPKLPWGHVNFLTTFDSHEIGAVLLKRSLEKN